MTAGVSPSADEDCEMQSEACREAFYRMNRHHVIHLVLVDSWPDPVYPSGIVTTKEKHH